eukprot:CAMPEP_0177634358 /NCGR_PEP_ID=MMETSP0447-20121125/3326_1 /TAXON_ID=0 /ORGANISM="Stygamoeba regulata, Strain BSH-02190019" /LENGTH=48 /DNA_ID= /DNA_START= /DNA_END= /DNA_ORIENTATION=
MGIINSGFLQVWRGRAAARSQEDPDETLSRALAQLALGPNRQRHAYTF